MVVTSKLYDVPVASRMSLGIFEILGKLRVRMMTWVDNLVFDVTANGDE